MCFQNNLLSSKFPQSKKYIFQVSGWFGTKFLSTWTLLSIIWLWTFSIEVPLNNFGYFLHSWTIQVRRCKIFCYFILNRPLTFSTIIHAHEIFWSHFWILCIMILTWDVRQFSATWGNRLQWEGVSFDK